MENLRVANTKEEIYKIFEDAIAQKTEVILWQKVRNERRMMLAEFKMIDREEGSILLKSLNNVVFSFDEEASLQVKSEYRNIVFKGKIKLAKDNLIVIQLPQEVHVEDLREKERRKIDLLGEHKLTLEKSMVKGNATSEWDLKILDITRGGASVEIHQEQMDVLEEGEKIFISAISSVVLPVRVEGEIVYIVPMKLGTESATETPAPFRMGIRFVTKLSEAVLSLLEK